MKSLLIHGENLVALEYLINDRQLKGKIDLIYIDPPFATGNNFTITDDRASTISNSKRGLSYTDNIKGDDYIKFLKDRIILLYELLSRQRFYLFAYRLQIGHYVKVMMDE